MQFKKKLKIPVLSLLVLILLPSVFALTITDTTFRSSVSNDTIFVDSITLDNVTVTNTTITFFNLTSVGSNFTNVNETFDATVRFVGLEINLSIRNVNTSTNLFSSTLGDQDFNATITPGQVLTIIESPTGPVTPSESVLSAFSSSAIVIFVSLFATLGVVFVLIFLRFGLDALTGNTNVDFNMVSASVGGVIFIIVVVGIGIILVSQLGLS